MTTHIDALREALAERCEELHRETHDPRFKSAAGVLRASSVGRPAVDDAPALEFAAMLMRGGLVRSRHQALRRAAAMLGEGDIDSAVRRLSRKAKRQKGFDIESRVQ